LVNLFALAYRGQGKPRSGFSDGDIFFHASPVRASHPNRIAAPP
jgi:hypothetical protein